MREQAPRRSTAGFGNIEGLQLLVEMSSWLAAWLILPVWLGLTGAGAGDFLLYALGAGLLLSAGVAADRPPGFAAAGDTAWFAAVCCFAVLIVGGALFFTAAAFR
jgi:hypothetical protein